jgi:hypothetical protein
MSSMGRLRKEKVPVRRITKARINYLSLCPRGKNLMPTVYKEAGVEAKLDVLLLKGTDELVEKGELIAVVYAPEKVDADQEVASEAVVKAMAYSHARGGFKLDLRHDEQPLSEDDAYVAESFLIQKGDPRFADVKDVNGKQVDVTGGWGVVVKLESPLLKGLYRQGAWAGVSMGGFASREADVVEKEDDMLDLETLKKAMADNNKSLAEAIVAGIVAATQKPADPIKKADDNFNPLDPKQVKARREKLQREQLLKSVDWDDPEAVAAYEEQLLKAEEEKAAIRASGQPLAKGDENQAPEGSSDDVLKKGFARGLKLAEIANKNRGK